MADDVIRTVDDQVTPVGDVTLVTVRGVVDAEEVPGAMSTKIQTTNDETVGLALYIPPLAEGLHGRGMFVQLRPEFARNMAASLLRMANEIDPKGMN